jgi:hypothetical protein
LVKPPRNIAVVIPQPLSVRQESSAKDNERYTEESDSRAKSLRAAQRLNWFTGLGGVVGIVTLLFLWLSLEQSRNAFEHGQRAWIGITKIVVIIPPVSKPADSPGEPITEDKLFVVPIIFKNGGMTPATHVKMDIDPNQFQGIDCAVPSIKSPYDSETSIGPGDTGSDNNTVLYLHKGCVDALNSGKAKFTVSGVIRYDDVFGFHRHTHFCARYEALATRQMAACLTGNDID